MAIAAVCAATCFSSAAMRSASALTGVFTTSGAIIIAGSGACACALIPTIGGQPATTPINNARDTFSHIERIAPSPVFELGPHKYTSPPAPA